MPPKADAEMYKCENVEMNISLYISTPVLGSL